MTYKLGFFPAARKEWDKLNPVIKRQFVKKLRERLDVPKVPSAALRGMPSCYKIKLRQLGYRLVYYVDDEVVTVAVISVGKRERGDVYENALARLHKVHVPILGKDVD